MFVRKGALKMCSKFTVEHPCGSAISIKLLCNFIEITLRHGCFPVNIMSLHHLYMGQSFTFKNVSRAIFRTLSNFKDGVFFQN